MDVQTRKSSKNKTLKRYSPWRRTMKKSSKKVQATEKTNQNNITHLSNDNLVESQSCANLSTLGMEHPQSCKKLSTVTQDQSSPAVANSSRNTTSTVEQASVTNANAAPDTPQTVTDQASDTHKRSEMIQATTGELLWCLGEFLCRRCPLIQDLSSMDLVTWLRLVDRYLLDFQYQSQSCINPSSLCFLYMLCREAVSSEVATMHELHAVVLTCLYVTCSYMGSETSYPMRPFLVDTCKQTFWTRCISISNVLSGEMLQMNTDQNFFYKVFAELKNQSQKEDLFTVYKSQ
ncbi:cyclin-dependent kinase 5 activator 1-like [Esox lucius]|uniref:cyclin-dependent kinase 5 activator 1-like n=1 Tax=Esox lucius TaxID=8010 RepID=UPI001476CA6D|nr:cyclin-dependent kinase 5 activator 1-like [Esox lucius]